MTQRSFVGQNKLMVLELFAGIGGFALGLHNTGGFQTIAFCEINEKRWPVLQKNFPGVPIAGDILKLSYNRKNRELIYDRKVIYAGPINIIVGGFPCQPFSVAGNRSGTNDDRHLWPEMLRIISEIRPSWVIGENVAGIVSVAKRVLSSTVESRSSHRTPEYDFYEAVHTRQEEMLLNSICEDLEKVRYDVQPFVVPACAVDAKHRRDRIWIVAHAEGERCTETRTDSCEPTQRPAGTSEAPGYVANTESNTPRGRSIGEQAPQSGPSLSGEALANANGINAQGIKRCRSYGEKRARQKQLPARSQNAVGRGVWPVEPRLGRVAHGVPGRVDRLEGLGNAVVPQVVEEFGYAILEAERKTT